MPQILSYEEVLAISQPLTISLSKYSNCLLMFINQTGSLGSILKAAATPSTADLDCFEEQPECKYLYSLKNMIGSTEIQFYELLLRRICSIAYEECGLAIDCILLLNISLALKHETFKEDAYYELIIANLRKSLKTVI